MGSTLNERITEDFVRSHFKGDPLFSQALVEEQKSKNPRIEKALQSASKSGSGGGKPEFVITFPSIADFIIVVECKANDAHHESVNRDQYAGFAVDGALLYASHLSKDFDVLAIAVSGQDLSKLRVSHFVWRKGATLYEDRPNDDHLLSLQSYLSAYQGQAITSQIEGLKVTEKAVEYNETLNQFSIPETERATFISAILVALQDDAFRSSYKLLTKPVDLGKSIIEAAQRVLEAEEIDAERRKVVLSQYKTIQIQDIAKSETVKRVNSTVPVANTILRDITADIEKNVYPLTKGGNRGLDVLGRFYSEFIRYSGSDARTGLVLTPPHITRLFCDLVGLTSKDVVLDPCCGTGGFLTSAMQYMWEKAGNDLALHDNIKKRQLLGIERRVDMFTHAVSNMMMRGDGKSHIFRGDCFDSKIISDVMKLNPTVAMLNPPYDVGAVGQLHFVGNALEMLAHGKCIAICQMSTAVSADKSIVEARRKLLEKHTLEAVMSMPPDLFHPVGVVTCVMVFRANQPHPSGYTTYLGHWRDDGFIKRKRKGRISDGSWPEKKERMLQSYVSRQSVPGLSVMRALDASSEWCAEAYMSSDVSTLDQKDFLETIKKFVAFRITESEKPVAVTALAAKSATLSLKDCVWREYRIDALFDVRKGSRLTKEDMEDGKTPFIGATETNNGVTARVNREPNHHPNTITVVYNGNSVAESFYQFRPYRATDDVNVLYPLFDLTVELAMFLITVIRREKYRFNYGRKWNKGRMQESFISLPSNDSGPDWEFMAAYVKTIPFSADLGETVKALVTNVAPPQEPLEGDESAVEAAK